MTRLAWLTLPALLAAAAMAPAQRSPAPAPTPASADDKGTYLGVLFGPVGEALYDQLPQVPRNQGVLVTHVLPESPAATAGLRRHDIVLQYDGRKVRDPEHLARLIQSDKPGHKLKLVLIRGGRETSAETTLALGPALQIAEAPAAGGRSGAVAKAVNKPGAPAPVSVAATPLGGGKMRVIIEYYPEGAGRPRTVTCEGEKADIDTEVGKLPERERGLARSALQRIRDLNSPRPAGPPS
jgi:hypothetical protein